MEQFLYYLLRASILMALFYGFYKLFFGKNTFHHFNRFALLFIVMLVAVLPVFRFNLLPEKKAEPVVIENLPMDFSNIPIVEISELPASPVEIPWIELLSAVFAFGFLFALMRYLLGLSQLIGIIRKSEKQTLADDTVLCITDNDISPFSWMKYIALSRKDVTADNRAIINHERAHIHLQHSFDMIFFDLFTCVFWFNPFSWLLRREVQSVHEYQADEQVLNNGIDAKQYQLLLIRKSVGEHKFALANNFRQRDLHKRITMMMKTKSNKRMKWNYAAALPVLFLAMVALSVPKLNAKMVEKEAEKTLEINESFTVMGQTVDETGKPMMGVKLIKEGENEAIISDMDGNFILNTERGTSVSFAMIGYKTQKITFNKPESNFKVSLEKGEGENKELITVHIAGRDDVTEAVDNQSKLAVSGFVKGKEGFVPGVAVVIKGSAVGTVTNPEGKFVIKAEKGDVLNFLMVGYKTFEYKVEKTENNLVIVLQPDDVVAVGAGKMEDLEVVGVRTLDGKQPLYVLDGVVKEKDLDLKTIKPDEIESISVLKNASATAVYGDKGKDGVVIITTKKGTNVRVEGVQGNLVGINSDVKESELSLRGASEGTKPLIVLDGEVKGKDFEINTIKPNEIESISVLKGNSAVQLYGDDGKNGVIDIITKKAGAVEGSQQSIKSEIDWITMPEKLATEWKVDTKKSIFYSREEGKVISRDEYNEMAKNGEVGFVALSKLKESSNIENASSLIKSLAKRYPDAEGLFMILPKKK